MKISSPTIKAIAKIITGDEYLSPYRTGPQLIRLFGEYVSDDAYENGFPSRWRFTEDKLRALNNKPALNKLITQILDPREFMDTPFPVQDACEYVNKRLKYDGYEIVIQDGLAKIRDLTGTTVSYRHLFLGPESEDHKFIDEQIEKAEKKLQEADFDGAITNSRSLLEAVLMEIERNLEKDPPKYDGDLQKLYKRVQKLLNLDPSRPDIDGTLKQVLTGFVSIISGLSGLSNKMGDRHVRSYRPAAHHAALVVDAAKTLVNFMYDTIQYQKEKFS